MEAKLSLVMPAFNEAQTITETINRVISLNFVNQLVVIDDGSTDGTRQILSGLNHEKIKIIFHEKIKEKGLRCTRVLELQKVPLLAYKMQTLNMIQMILPNFFPTFERSS
jgi:glycosyltransferase involved in cell wall biosynthesis